jgi:putative ABC transport system permease protein
MPPGYVYPESQQVWAPKIFTEEERSRRSAMYYTVVGRLKPGISIEAASAELATISQQLGREYPRTNADVGVNLVPLPDRVLGDVRSGLFILFGAVAFLLLIACANVTNLLLADASRRGKEFAVRVALGARSGRILRQLLTESLILSIAGGLAGLLLAKATLDAIRLLAPVTFPRITEVSIDPVALGFVFGVSALTAVIVGLVPARRAAHSSPGHALVAGSRSATGGRAARQLRGGLVVSEMALACVLLVGAGLLIRSFVSLLRVERGYRTENVVALTVHAWDYYPSDEARIGYVREARARLEAVPGVLSAAATSSLPLLGAIGTQRATFDVVDRPAPEGAQRPAAHATATTPKYFEVMGMTLKRGRLFTDTDDAGSTPVVVINESLARQYFPDEDPIGKRMEVRFAAAPSVREIIGVVGDVRHNGLQDEPRPGLFVPHAQKATGSLTFVARTAVPSASVLRQAQDALQSLNGALPISRVTTIETLLAESLRTRRFQLWLLGGFSFTALILAAIGIYGVISYTTRERTRELGLRMALGARAGDVLRLVLRDGTALALLGVVLGIVGAAALTRLLSRMLYNVTPLDPLTFVAGAAVLLLVAISACYLPARRAAMLDPVIALREE